MINISKPYKDDMIIPIFVSKNNDEEVSIDVYRDYYEIAVEYEKYFSDDYFSDKALRFLDTKIGAITKAAGYTREHDFNQWYAVYKMFSPDDIKDYPMINVKDLAFAEYMFDETDFEADIIRENGEPASVVIIDDRIASICAANFFVDDEIDEVELSVETIPEFRRHGYAAAVIGDMAKRVFDMGKYPTYRASCFNYISLRTALSAGFKLVGKEYYYNCYKEEN